VSDGPDGPDVIVPLAPSHLPLNSDTTNLDPTTLPAGPELTPLPTNVPTDVPVDYGI
jgi:hypothetical protein